MSRLWQSGLEMGSLGVFSSIFGTPTISTVQKKTGTRSLYMSGGGQCGLVTFSANKAEVFIRCALYVDTASGTLDRNGFLTILDDISTRHLTFRRNNTTGVIQVLRGTAAGTLLVSSITAIALDTWYVLFIRATIDDAAGIVQLRINASTAPNDIDFVGDTRNAGNAVIRTVGFGALDSAASYIVDFQDDLAINDTAGAVNNSWVGDGGIYGLSPTGAAVLGHTDWTPSAGANWQCVDEIPPTEDTDYVSTSTVNNKDTYVMANTPAAGAIAAVTYWLRARKEAAGDTVNTRRLFHIGASEYAGATHVLGTAYSDQMEILETSPDTGIAWTCAELDAMEVGMECV